MIQWIKRERVEKEEGHVAWIDHYWDTETGVQYLGMNGNLTPRLGHDGRPVLLRQ